MSDSPQIPLDEMFQHFITAPDNHSADIYLTKIIEDYSRPIVKQILLGKFKGDFESEYSASFQQNYEELCRDCEVRITGWLLKQRMKTISEEIENFRGFIAKLTFNVWNDYLRKRFPRRAQLKNNIRYTLKHDSKFTTWKDDSGKLWAGFPESKINNSDENETVEYLLEVIRKESRTFAQDSLPKLLSFVFEKNHTALKLNTLTTLIAKLWKIEDFSEISLDDSTPDLMNLANQSKVNFIKQYKPEKIWQVIKFLPARQRIVFLYNIRDLTGRELLLLFFNTKIATLSEIAEVLCVSVDKVTVILSKLPLSDKEIAKYMNLPEEKIANIRKSAKDNINRRLEGRKQRNMKQLNDNESEIFIQNLLNYKPKVIFSENKLKAEDYLN